MQRGLEQLAARWAAWSGALDDAFGLHDDMVRVSAEGSLGLSIEISAVVWFLEETEAVLDAKGMRQLRALAVDAPASAASWG